MQFQCLGPLHVIEDGQQLALGGPKQRLALATLVLHANEEVTADRLVTAVWDGDAPASGRNSLLYDFWREPDGAYIVTRLLTGGGLGDLLRDGESDARAGRTIAGQVTCALAAVHRRGVVHGGLRSDAVHFDAERNAFLCNFAIVESGDARSDVYNLGVLLSEVLHDADGVVATVLARSVARDAARRHPDAGALLDDLERRGRQDRQSHRVRCRRPRWWVRPATPTRACRPSPRRTVTTSSAGRPWWHAYRRIGGVTGALAARVGARGSPPAVPAARHAGGGRRGHRRSHW